MSNSFYIGKKEVKIPIFQGGMGIGISLGRVFGLLTEQKKAVSEQFLFLRLVIVIRIFIKILWLLIEKPFMKN